MQKFEIKYSIELSDEAVALLREIEGIPTQTFYSFDKEQWKNVNKSELIACGALIHTYSVGNPTYVGFQLTKIGRSILQILNS